MGAHASVDHLSPRRSSRAKALPAVADAWEAYGRLCAWRLKHIPWLLHAGGAAVFFRLMSAPKAAPLNMSALYRSAGASPPKVLLIVNELHREGLVTLIVDPGDKRRRHVEATDLLRRLGQCYVQAIVQFLEDDLSVRQLDLEPQRQYRRSHGLR